MSSCFKGSKRHIFAFQNQHVVAVALAAAPAAGAVAAVAAAALCSAADVANALRKVGPR